jgi:hypothetical protein
MTGSALATGLMFMARTLPGVLFGSIAGVFVDRWGRKWTISYQGRVFGVFGMTAALMTLVGQGSAGALADPWGADSVAELGRRPLCLVWADSAGLAEPSGGGIRPIEELTDASIGD